MDSSYCPSQWSSWVQLGRIDALVCERPVRPRSILEQKPQSKTELAILRRIEQLTPREFEFAARRLLPLLDSRFIDLVVTPPSRDGGRDIIGGYRIGTHPNQRMLSIFAEAKRWKGAVGVRPVSRLISRLRHNDIGVFVTTSYFDNQVQDEIISDNHPIILVSGRDIARLLMQGDIAGDGHDASFTEWLASVKQDAASSI